MKITLEHSKEKSIFDDFFFMHTITFFFQISLIDKWLNQLVIDVYDLNLPENLTITLNPVDEAIINKIWGNQGIAVLNLLEFRRNYFKGDESTYGKIMFQIYDTLLFCSKDNHRYYWYYGDMKNISNVVYKKPETLIPEYEPKHFKQEFLNFTVIENGKFKDFPMYYCSHICYIIDIVGEKKYHSLANFGPPLNIQAKFVKYFDLNLIWGQQCKTLITYLTNAISQIEEKEECKLTRELSDAHISAHWVFRSVLVDLLDSCMKYPNAYVFSDNQYLRDDDDEVEKHESWKTKLGESEGIMFKKIYQNYRCGRHN